ncbi:13060_t:CDS:1, partial [Cetraspora pellucida]
APEINKKGVKKILTCYESGKSCLEAILKQDIYKTEPRVTFGHGARDVDHYTYAELEKMRKQEKKKINRITIQEEVSYSLPNNSLNPLTIQQQSPKTSLPLQVKNNERPRRQRTTKVEKNILFSLLEYNSSLPNSKIIKVFNILNMISSDSRTVDRIRLYWRNNRRNQPDTE